MRLVRNIIMLVSCGLLTMGAAGCANTETVDNTLNKVIEAKDVAKDMTNQAVESAKNGLNIVGNAAGFNGDYENTSDALVAYADKFKNQVKDKLEEIDPAYVDFVNNHIEELKQAEADLDDAAQETNYTDTESYKYFSNFNYNNYDVTYTLCNVTDETKQYLRGRVVFDKSDGNINAYCSSCTFNADDTDALKLLGLTYKSCQNNTWYLCNQVEKTKKLSSEPIAVNNLDRIFAMCDSTHFKSSTLNNLVAKHGVNIDEFVDGDTVAMFVYKEGKWIGVVYEVGDITSYVVINDVKKDVSTKLLNAGVDYTFVEE